MHTKVINILAANKAKDYPGQSLNVYDDQPTKSDNDTSAMDTPGARGKLLHSVRGYLQTIN